MGDDYLKNVGTDAENIARDGDELVSAITGGPANETVSRRVALAARDGKRWACWFCWFLSWAVQPDHCAKMFTNDPTPWWVYLRATFWFVAVIFGLPALIWWRLTH